MCGGQGALGVVCSGQRGAGLLETTGELVRGLRLERASRSSKSVERSGAYATLAVDTRPEGPFIGVVAWGLADALGLWPALWTVWNGLLRPVLRPRVVGAVLHATYIWATPRHHSLVCPHTHAPGTCPLPLPCRQQCRPKHTLWPRDGEVQTHGNAAAPRVVSRHACRCLAV